MPEVRMVYSDSPPHARVRLDTRSAPAEILAACDTMHTSDKRAELWKKITLATGILGIVGAFVGFVVADNTGPIPIFVGIGVTVVSFFARFIIGGSDVDDRKLDVVRKVVGTLSPDMSRKQSVYAKADFGGYEKTEPLSNTVGWLSGSGVKEFEKQWLQLSFTLLDGTRVRLECRSKVKRKQRRKRKYTKIKDGIIDEVQLSFAAPKGKAFDPNKGPRLEKALAVGRAYPRLAGVRVKPKEAQLKFRTKRAMRHKGRGGWSSTDLAALLDGDSVLRVVATSYRMLMSSSV